MTERLSPRQIKKMIQTSKGFEQVWRVWTHWTDYPPEEIAKQEKFMQENEGNVVYMGEHDEQLADVYGRISMGIYHHPEIQIPPEHKYHPNAN